MNRTRNPKRSSIPFTAADGVACLRVPLAGNRGDAIIEAGDMARLRQAGVTENYSFNRAGKAQYRYVRATLEGGNTVTVARFIAGARAGQYVRYHDSNPLNLRRGNLYLIEGKSKMDCAALIAESTEGEAKGLPQIFEKASDGKANGLHPPLGGRLQNAASIEGVSQVAA